MDNLTVTESCGKADEQNKMPSSASSLVLPSSFILIQEPTEGPEPPLSIILVPVPDEDAQKGTSELEVNVNLPTNEKAQKGTSELEVNVNLSTNEKDMLVSNNFEKGDEECRNNKNENSEEPSVAGESVAVDTATRTNQTNNHVDLSTETLTCPVCHQTSTSPSELQAHTLTHSVENLFICEECGMSFIEESDFIIHKETHPENAEFSPLFDEADLELCSLPDETDLDVCSLPEADWELSDLLGEKELIMPSLPNEKISECTLPDNVDIDDSESCDDPSPVKETFPCDADACGKSFQSMAELLAHDTEHSGEKSYKCDLCPRSFRHKTNLIGHMRRHTGEKPFQCTKCNKRFRARNTLANHERSHTKERPYKCTVCSKDYSYRTSLVVHMSTHTKEKPFDCSVCKQAFACAASLKAHESLHSEETYRCDVCENVYKSKTVLMAHKKRAHTTETSTKCSVCRKKLGDKWSLDRHMKIHSRGPIAPHVLAARLWSSY